MVLRACCACPLNNIMDGTHCIKVFECTNIFSFVSETRTTYRKKKTRSPSLKYNKLLVQKTPVRCKILPSGTNSAHVCMRIFSCRRAVILVLIRVSADLPFPSRATRSVYSPARRTGGHAHGTRTGTAGFACSPHGHDQLPEARGAAHS